MKQAVSLCMIVRNEETNLGECLAGVSGLFAEMIVVDTGSSDGTRAVAERLGARVVDFPWTDDFAAARNESRRHAGGEWIFWLDADDRIDAHNRQRLADLFDRLGTFDAGVNPLFMMSCVSRMTHGPSDYAMTHGRLFAKDSSLAWTGRVHEQLVPASREEPITLHLTDVVIRHEGYNDPALTSRKQFRDLRLLEQQYLLNPDDSLTLFYLARIHVAQGRHAEGLRLARRCVRSDSRGAFSTTPKAYLLVIECLWAMGRVTEALAISQQGAARFPADVELLYSHGAILHFVGRLTDAERCLRRLAQYPGQLIPLGGCPVDDARGRTLLARVLAEQGRGAEADTELRRLLADQPTCMPAWILLASVNLALGRRHDVDAVLLGLEGYPNTVMERTVVRSKLCLADHRFNEARHWIREAMAARPGAVEPWIALSDVEFEEGRDWQRCVDVHRKVLSLDPVHAEVHRRLERLLNVGPQAPAAPLPVVPAARAVSGFQSCNQLAFSA